MDKAAKIIRVMTLAPLMACVMLVIVFCTRPEEMGGVEEFVFSLLFLVVFPLLAYPLQRFIPGYKDKGRDGQRNLAIIFAVSGYVFGCLLNLLLHSPTGMWVIYLGYLLSGLGVFAFNRFFHLKASGHACGVAGPAALLVYFRLPAVIPGLVILALTWWASLRMKRHTWQQLLGGTLIPIAAVTLIWLAA